MPEALALSPSLPANFWAMTLESIPVDETNWNLTHVIGVGAGITAILCAIAAAINGLMKAGVRRQKFNDLLTVTEDFPEWRGRVDRRLSGISKRLTNIEDKTGNLILFLLGGPREALFGTNSPMTLTSHGKEVARSIDASSWAKGEVEKHRAEVAGKSDYWIQKYCIRYCLFEYTPSESYLAVLEKCAFEMGVQMDGILQVLAIVLRDELSKS
ncbi:MAG: hypothetical protein OXH11_13800 [Candidatus Aminicenantes bacterium]|nr:hypothetical protein [Candidatus Aminicenantes bacterium]